MTDGYVGPYPCPFLDQAPLWLLATCVNSFWLVTTDDGSRTDSLALAIATCLRFSPIEFEVVPRFLPLLGLMTSRHRGENAVPLSPRGVGIVPTIGLSVVIGTDVPLLSFPRFHGFGQTNRSPPSLSFVSLISALTPYHIAAATPTTCFGQS